MMTSRPLVLEQLPRLNMYTLLFFFCPPRHSCAPILGKRETSGRRTRFALPGVPIRYCPARYVVRQPRRDQGTDKKNAFAWRGRPLRRNRHGQKKMVTARPLLRGEEKKKVVLRMHWYLRGHFYRGLFFFFDKQGTRGEVWETTAKDALAVAPERFG